MIDDEIESESVVTMLLTLDLSVSKKGTSNFVRNIFRHSTNIDDQLVKISTWDHGGILGYTLR